MSNPVTFEELKKRLHDAANTGDKTETVFALLGYESLEQRVRELLDELHKEEMDGWITERLTALLGEPQHRGPAGDGTEGGK